MHKLFIMKYRVFQDKQFIGSFSNRVAFQEAFSGENSNSPTRGDTIKVNEKTYVVKWYTEHDSESFTENEHRQKENDWFADIIVN